MPDIWNTIFFSYLVIVRVRPWSFGFQTSPFRRLKEKYSTLHMSQVTDEICGEVGQVSNSSRFDISSSPLYQDIFRLPQLPNGHFWSNMSSLAKTMSQLKCINVPVPSFVAPLKTVGITYLHWPSRGQHRSLSNQERRPVIVLLHGFDCSCLEFRYLGPLLSDEGYDVYAPDILGWGFTQLEYVSNFSADAKIEALESFLRAVLLPNGDLEGKSDEQDARAGNNKTASSLAFRRTPSLVFTREKQKPTVDVCLVGASLGAAAAVDLCSRFCSPPINDRDIRVHSMVWISAQVFLDGNLLRSVPLWWAKLLIPLLRVKQFRKIVDLLSIHDTKQYFDSLHEGNLALEAWNLQSARTGWKEAMLSFFIAGGFNPSTKLDFCKKNVSAHLILSGSNDGILGDTFAHKLHAKLVDNSKLVWIAKCGHFPHIEHPHATADAILEFLRNK